MKAVITGATGHLGQYVVHELASLGYEVVAASRSGKVPELPFEAAAVAGVRGVRVDVSRESAVAELAAELGENVLLVHLAAWHPPATAATTAADRAALLEVNVHGTLRVLQAAREGVSAFIYASTFEVYGIPEGHEPVLETARLNPVTDYGATKLSGEDHSFAFAYEQKTRVVSLRLPAIYGPGEFTSRALPNFLRQVARGERPKIYGDGADLRDQLHACDAARSIVCAARSSHAGIYNAADGYPHSIAELASEALRISGLGGSPQFLPREKTRYDFHMNVDKIRAELGFEPDVSLEAGMLEELRWMRSLG